MEIKMRGQKLWLTFTREAFLVQKSKDDEPLSFVTEFRVAILSENTVFCVIVAHGVITY